MLVRLAVRFLVIVGALFAIAHIVPGIAIDNVSVAVVAALLWAGMSLLLRPLLSLALFPVTLLTLGLFSFVLNALLFWLTAELVGGFTVSGFLPALEGSLLLSIVVWFTHKIL